MVHPPDLPGPRDPLDLPRAGPASQLSRRSRIDDRHRSDQLVRIRIRLRPEHLRPIVRDFGHVQVAREVVVLAAKGTILPVLARRGEWVQVGLSPDLRKTGMVMRWYKNENNGWIHDSMLDVVPPDAK